MLSKLHKHPWLKQLPIQSKVALGYGLSLSIAITGVGLGVALADQQQHKAEAIAADARQELELISNLKSESFQTFVAQQGFKAALKSPNTLPAQSEKWRAATQRFQQTWEKFEATEGGTKGQEALERAGETEAVNTFLEKYENTTEDYFNAVDQILADIDTQNLTQAELSRLQNNFSQLERSQFMQVMDNFSEELLILLTPIIREEYQEAEMGMRHSHKLRLWVIISSMSISVGISIVLSIVISRAIAHPIKALTSVTQQALDESNFNLQAPVLSSDEVGTLATAFNQLIASVQVFRDQQQQYSQTLEQSVAERTQELSEKNIQLQDLLEKFHSTQAQMLQSEKMSSLGQLVAGVAHEINNPVNFIHGNLTYANQYARDLLDIVQLYQKHYPNSASEIIEKTTAIDLAFVQADFAKILDSMALGTERIREIVVSLRNFSRLDEAEFKAVNLHEGIDSTLLILKHRLKATHEHREIEVIQDYADLPMVECYSGQLNQVLMNILTNAIDALETDTSQSAPQITIRTALVDQEWVQISIADNGPGMSEQVQQQIFNPFFTTKPVGKGTGIGMSISYQIIEKHYGKLTYSSNPGQGTEFKIEIPIRQQH